MKRVHCSIITRQLHMQIHMRRFDVYMYVIYDIFIEYATIYIDKIPYPVNLLGLNPSFRSIHPFSQFFGSIHAKPKVWTWGWFLDGATWRWTQEHWQLPSREFTYPPDKAYFSRWDMLIPWRVFVILISTMFKGWQIIKSTFCCFGMFFLFQSLKRLC